MAIKSKKGYICGYCSKFFKTAGEADKCKDGHDLIYMAISKEDLNRLINFIYLKEEKLITDSLMRTLNRHVKFMRLVDIKREV